MRINKNLLLAALLGLVGSYYAGLLYSQNLGVNQEDPVADALGDKIDLFFHNLTNTTLDQMKVFQDLVAGGRLARQEESIKALVLKTKEFDEQFGEYQSHERISATQIGTDLFVLTYLYKASDYPVVWHFTYYRDFRRLDSNNTEADWVIIGVRFDTRLDPLAT